MPFIGKSLEAQKALAIRFHTGELTQLSAGALEIRGLTTGIAKFGVAMGRYSPILGAGIDVGMAASGQQSWTKAGVNTAIGTYTSLTGPPGWAIGSAYFFIDSTIGWDNAIEINSNYYRREKRVFPIESGIPSKVY